MFFAAEEDEKKMGEETFLTVLNALRLLPTLSLFRKTRMSKIVKSTPVLVFCALLSQLASLFAEFESNGYSTLLLNVDNLSVCDE
jgi:hypothetical protein